MNIRSPIRQPDDPGVDAYPYGWGEVDWGDPEPDVGHYPGWLTAIIWVTPIVLSWTLVYVVLIEVVLR